MGLELTAYVPITKVDEDQRLVYGIATSETRDSQGDILDWDGTLEALKGYAEYGNVREMHQPSAVGKAVQINVNDGARQVEVVSKVIDDAAWEKVKAGVYKGYSIGGAAKETRTEMAKVDGADVETRRILKWDWTETSLVDRPANPSAAITLFKREPSSEAAGAGDAHPDASAGTPPAAVPLTKGDDSASVCAAIKGLIAKKAADGSESYDLELLVDALRLMEWFATDELYDKLSLAVKAHDLRKRQEENPMDPTEAIAGLVKSVEGLTTIVTELSQRDPLAKLDFSTLAKAEDVQSLGARLEKVEGRLEPGGPFINADAARTAMEKRLDPLGNLDDISKADVAALDARIAKAANPHEREQLGAERAQLLMRKQFGA